MSCRYALGYDQLRGTWLELQIPDDLSHHVTLLGVTGSGKTSSASVLAEAALQAELAVLVVDAKGGGLRAVSRHLAQRRRVRYVEVVPASAGDGVGYDPCRLGSRAQVADKLVTAFSHGPNAEIYRLIAQEAIAVVVGALRTLDERVTVARLRAELDQRRLGLLARRVGDVSPALATDLEDLAGRGRVTADALDGMRARLGALLRGLYGDLFDADSVLDLQQSLRQLGVTYIGLPALAASNDTTLMARVLIQDLKQVTYEQMADPRARPALLILDEFAALEDPQQLNDLLRQAREARVAVVTSSQHLPDELGAHALRSAMLGAGLLIAHRTIPADAEAVAAVIGTESGTEVTRQLDGGRTTGAGSLRRVEQYAVHPNLIKRQGAGEAVVLVQVGGRRLATIQIRSMEGT